MECLDFRRLLLSDPYSRDPEFLEHRRACADCRAASERGEAFERRLKTAFEVDVPESLADEVLLGQTTSLRQNRFRARRHWFLSMAASVAIGVALAVLLLPDAGQAGIPRFMVEHVRHEPESLVRTEPVAAEKIAALFFAYGVELEVPLEGVTFAAPCRMYRGEGVHLVLRDERGPVTVMYMPEVTVDETASAELEGFNVRMIPVSRGTLALLAYAGHTVERVQDQVQRSLHIGI